MRPLAYIFPYSVAFWVILLWAYVPEFRIIQRARKSVRREGSQDRSLGVLLYAMSLASLGAFPLAFVRGLRFPSAWGVPLLVIGLVLLVGGSLLRRHCWRMLGESFTGDVQAHEGQRVVTTGAYAFLRHPSYTAGILMNAGIGLALGSWGSTALLVGGTVVGYIYRMNLEERTLLGVIGEPYREFMRTRKRIIPFIY